MEVCQTCGIMTEVTWCADCQEVYCKTHYKTHACRDSEEVDSEPWGDS